LQAIWRLGTGACCSAQIEYETLLAKFEDLKDLHDSIKALKEYHPANIYPLTGTMPAEKPNVYSD